MNILLIEDDVRVADFLQRGLQAEGYTVTWFRNGREGLAAAEAFARTCTTENLAGVVILDVMLPELDGLSLCQMLRQRNHQVPVLMLSAMGESQERADGLRRGADDYLAKPFDFDELLARIEALMRRTKATTAPKLLQIGQIILDRQLPGLRSATGEVLLSALEMAMIELLAAQAGATVSRERILARVWAADRDPLTNVVDVYVSRLRRKLASLDPDVKITAIRGLGYRLTVTRP
ncbi:DNA-binding response regulator, OmpR family, contains REC and winged-helix (wHTH) domain [Rhizobium sp. RU33A]|uniref:response regulator transcription factor n=1 Tax=Rhizobium sp. RU33A TaxID=1907413 RepID=UPI0009554C3E|nr:response regulator transcription factor [Rhizobium sp. RU33A]SIQ35438.1 DNA-binding response regulator, OmpR family, contains REC and winged-helix (wHTH) domain [Rhizobium sp. RU33A]